MNGYVLDTNVLSEVIRKRPDPRVMERLRAIDAADLFTSEVCVMELRFGAARHPHGQRLWARVEAEVLSRVTALPFDGEAARVAGDVLADLERRGEPIGVEDVVIGATALAARCAVATRNVRHLARIPNLRVECWWDES